MFQLRCRFLKGKIKNSAEGNGRHALRRCQKRLDSPGGAYGSERKSRSAKEPRVIVREKGGSFEGKPAGQKSEGRGNRENDDRRKELWQESAGLR